MDNKHNKKRIKSNNPYNGQTTDKIKTSQNKNSENRISLRFSEFQCGGEGDTNYNTFLRLNNILGN